MEITDKVTIVTGASSGIGEATARLLSQRGAKLALVARTETKLKQLSQTLPNSLALAADMSKENEIRQMTNRVVNYFGRIDILVNNAGQGYFGPLEHTDIDQYRYLFELNVLGPLIAMQSVIPVMRSHSGGMIVNISSGTSLMYIPFLSAYSSTKRALNGLTITAREELAKDNIIVSLIHPYITNTNFGKNALRPADKSFQASIQTDSSRPPADPPELVAEKIVEAIQSETAEIYLHEWMQPTH